MKKNFVKFYLMCASVCVLTPAAYGMNNNNSWMPPYGNPSFPQTPSYGTPNNFSMMPYNNLSASNTSFGMQPFSGGGQPFTPLNQQQVVKAAQLAPNQINFSNMVQDSLYHSVFLQVSSDAAMQYSLKAILNYAMVTDLENFAKGSSQNFLNKELYLMRSNGGGFISQGTVNADIYEINLGQYAHELNNQSVSHSFVQHGSWYCNVPMNLGIEATSAVGYGATQKLSLPLYNNPDLQNSYNLSLNNGTLSLAPKENRLKPFLAKDFQKILVDPLAIAKNNN